MLLLLHLYKYRVHFYHTCGISMKIFVADE